jgi:hypothetical protein
MTDQQRGAYTPQQEAPLQFDAGGPASRRPMPMALMASGALLLLLLAFLAVFYSRGVRSDNEPPRPVGEPIATLKSAPAAGAQPSDSGGDVDVSAPQNVPAKAPAFAPPPELPKPRLAPAPGRLTVQTMTATDMAKQTSGPPLKSLRPAMASNLAAPAARPAAESATAAPTPGGARVQIGAFSSAALADRGWSDIAALMPGLMGGKSKHIEPVQKDGQTLYRTSVTGFSDRTAAAAFCDSLKSKGKICFVKS